MDFVAGFFLDIFVGKSAQKNPPRKSPANPPKFVQQKSPTHFCRGTGLILRPGHRPGVPGTWPSRGLLEICMIFPYVHFLLPRHTLPKGPQRANNTTHSGIGLKKRIAVHVPTSPSGFTWRKFRWQFLIQFPGIFLTVNFAATNSSTYFTFRNSKFHHRNYCPHAKNYRTHFFIFGNYCCKKLQDWNSIWINWLILHVSPPLWIEQKQAAWQRRLLLVQWAP